MTEYGSELSCLGDIASDGRMVTGFRVVAEAIYRRLTTPRGRLIGDPDYGFDLTQYVNADVSPRDLAGLRAAVVAECAKDERVDSISVESELSTAGVLTLTILIGLVTLDEFTLVITASEVTVELVSVES